MSRDWRAVVAGVVVACLAVSLPVAPSHAQRLLQEFTDTAGHWADANIRALQAFGVLEVPEDGKFRPDEQVTRLDFAVWAARALELGSAGTGGAQPPFKDWTEIPEALRGEVLAAVRAGLLKGYEDGTFRPARSVTRAEMGVIFGRALIGLGLKADPRYLLLFADAASIPPWASDAALAVQQQIIRGHPGELGGPARFVPGGLTTRAEAAVMLGRFIEVRAEIVPIQRPAPGPRTRLPGRFVAAYYINTDEAYASLVANGRGLDALIYGSWEIRPDGAVVGYDSPRTLAWASQNGLPVLLMVQNFDRASNRALLTNPEAQAKAILYLAEQLRARGYAGINLDFEYVDADLRASFTLFVRRLRDALGAKGLITTVSVVAKTGDNPASNWSGAYDYAALGQVADYVMVMTYDQHYSGGPAGPVASLGWVERVLRYALSAGVPASKLVMGLPGYGYAWPDPPNGQKARALTTRQALELVAQRGISLTWDAAAGEHTFRYTDDAGVRRLVYFNSPESLSLRLALAHQLGIAGVVQWRVGYEPETFWTRYDREYKRLYGAVP